MKIKLPLYILPDNNIVNLASVLSLQCTNEEYEGVRCRHIGVPEEIYYLLGMPTRRNWIGADNLFDEEKIKERKSEFNKLIEAWNKVANGDFSGQ